ncbi:hypothetical protein ACWV26_16065 [Rummeliibacillus sp. JY-2-4R]
MNNKLMEKEYGGTFKTIRLSKNFEQIFVSKNVLHQTSYSKFELGKTDVTSKKFVALLRNIEMDFEEFDFIHHSYSYSPRDAIIQKYYNLKFIDDDILQEIIKEAEIYLKKEDDRYIENLLTVSKGLRAFGKNNNIDHARLYAEIVWKRLEQLDTWYLSDLRLINSILFIFPIGTAMTITKFAMTQLYKYKQHSLYKKLLLPFKYNLVHLLIRENHLEEAYKINEELIEDFKKEKAYFHISLCYLRKGLLQGSLGIVDKINYIEQANQVSIFFNDNQLQKHLEYESQYVSELLERETLLGEIKG